MSLHRDSYNILNILQKSILTLRKIDFEVVYVVYEIDNIFNVYIY